MILQVHDELLFEAPHNEIDRLRPLVSKAMEQVHELVVPPGRGFESRPQLARHEVRGQVARAREKGMMRETRNAAQGGLGMKQSAGRIVGFAACAALALGFWTKPISAQSAGDPFRAKDTPQTAGFADRLYILDGGVGHAGSAVAGII